VENTPEAAGVVDGLTSWQLFQLGTRQ
jgi:hypothetical protein